MIDEFFPWMGERKSLAWEMIDTLPRNSRKPGGARREGPLLVVSWKVQGQTSLLRKLKTY